MNTTTATQAEVTAQRERLLCAETILDQLGGRRFIAMTGAKNFIADSGALIFTLPRSRKIRIQLTDADLYDMTLYRLGRNRTISTVAESTGLYFDQLQPEFTRITGLDTHL